METKEAPLEDIQQRFHFVHNQRQSLDQDSKNRIITCTHVLYHTKLHNTLISDYEPICVQTQPTLQSLVSGLQTKQMNSNSEAVF